MDCQKFGPVARGNITRPLGAGDHAATAKAANDLILGLEPDRNHGVLYPQMAKRLQRIGTEIESGADLGELRRLFINRNVDPAPVQRQRRCSATEAATDNDDFWRARHLVSPGLGQRAQIIGLYGAFIDRDVDDRRRAASLTEHVGDPAAVVTAMGHQMGQTHGA